MHVAASIFTVTRDKSPQGVKLERCLTDVVL